MVERADKKIERDRKAEELAAKERGLNAQYLKIKDSEAMQDLLAKLKSFSDYHIKVAKDRVGFKQESDSEGNLIQVTVRLTGEEQLAELQRAAGIDEIIDYLDRRFTIKPKAESTKKEQTNG